MIKAQPPSYGEFCFLVQTSRQLLVAAVMYPIARLPFSESPYSFNQSLANRVTLLVSSMRLGSQIVPPSGSNLRNPHPSPSRAPVGRTLKSCFAEHAIACMFGCSGHPHAGTAHRSDQCIISVCAVSRSTMDPPSMHGCAETLSKLPKVITPNPHPITKKCFIVPRMLPS
jgi:hypothetical protein